MEWVLAHIEWDVSHVDWVMSHASRRVTHRIRLLWFIDMSLMWHDSVYVWHVSFYVRQDSFHVWHASLRCHSCDMTHSLMKHITVRIKFIGGGHSSYVYASHIWHMNESWRRTNQLPLCSKYVWHRCQVDVRIIRLLEYICMTYMKRAIHVWHIWPMNESCSRMKWYVYLTQCMSIYEWVMCMRVIYVYDSLIYQHDSIKCDSYI